jgi:TatD DNase family protein
LTGLIDTHCHLDAREFDDDRDAVCQRAHAAGIERIVLPAVERANFAAVSSLCREYAMCRPAYGIHPLFVANAHPEDLDCLDETLAREPAVAVGEIGLDRYVTLRDDACQERYFVAQLKLASKHGLPVLLHTRRAVDGVLKHLRRIAVPGGIAHAFSGSRQQADIFIGLGFKLGFGGAMTYARASRLRELARSLPLDAIVLETDAPDIPPAWLGQGGEGRRNAPAELPRIAEELAALRGMDAAALCAATTANARAVLPGLIDRTRA